MVEYEGEKETLSIMVGGGGVKISHLRSNVYYKSKFFFTGVNISHLMKGVTFEIYIKFEMTKFTHPPSPSLIVKNIYIYIKFKVTYFYCLCPLLPTNKFDVLMEDFVLWRSVPVDNVVLYETVKFPWSYYVMRRSNF